MSTYQLQIKQIVDYPRCRIYQQFIRFLMEDRSIRVSGGSGLFYFTVGSHFDPPWMAPGNEPAAPAPHRRW